MTTQDLENTIKTATDFRSLDDYRNYLQQLCDDNRDSGKLATAHDYATMVDVLNSIARKLT
jgi:hypothetical protein